MNTPTLPGKRLHVLNEEHTTVEFFGPPGFDLNADVDLAELVTAPN